MYELAFRHLPETIQRGLRRHNCATMLVTIRPQPFLTISAIGDDRATKRGVFVMIDLMLGRSVQIDEKSLSDGFLGRQFKIPENGVAAWLIKAANGRPAECTLFIHPLLMEELTPKLIDLNREELAILETVEQHSSLLDFGRRFPDLVRLVVSGGLISHSGYKREWQLTQTGQLALEKARALGTIGPKTEAEKIPEPA